MTLPWWLRTAGSWANGACDVQGNGGLVDATGGTVNFTCFGVRPAITLDMRENPITVVSQPEDWAGELNEYPEIRVVAEGEGLTYQWYYRDDGQTEWRLSSETDNAYDSFPLRADRNGRELYCVVTDEYGSRPPASP